MQRWSAKMLRSHTWKNMKKMWTKTEEEKETGRRTPNFPAISDKIPSERKCVIDFSADLFHISRNLSWDRQDALETQEVHTGLGRLIRYMSDSPKTPCWEDSQARPLAGLYSWPGVGSSRDFILLFADDIWLSVMKNLKAPLLYEFLYYVLKLCLAWVNLATSELILWGKRLMEAFWFV